MKEKDKDHNFLNNYQLFLKKSGYDRSIFNKKHKALENVSKIYNYKKTEGYFDHFLKKHKENFKESFLPKTNSLEEKSTFQEKYPTIKKVRKGLVIFSKDVILGSALFITSTFGIVGVSVLPHVLLNKPHPTVSYTPQEKVNISPEYNDFIKKTAVYANVDNEIAKLKDQGLLNEVNSGNNYTPLTYAIHYKNISSIEKLVENGAALNLPSKPESIALIEQLSYFNPSFQVNFQTHIKIADYLLSKGLDWRQNNYQLLKNTAQYKEWRDYFISYFTKNDPKGLEVYKNILKDNVDDKDILIYDTLKTLK